jgi:hypothetical protein
LEDETGRLQYMVAAFSLDKRTAEGNRVDTLELARFRMEVRLFH